MLITAAALLSGLAAIGGANAWTDSSANPCSVAIQGTTFNVQTLRRNGGFYLVNDASNNNWSKNFTYYINICGNIDPAVTLPGSAATSCNTTYTSNAGQPVAVTGPAPAFQLNNRVPPGSAQACQRLGAQLMPGDTSTVIWSLYDPTNPSRGIAMNYTGGDRCANGVQRSLQVWMLCYNDPTNILDVEMVYEGDDSTSLTTCAYEIFLKTLYGCPADCPAPVDTVTGYPNLCGGHGVCDYDRVQGASRCFCNGGWTGSDCSTVDAPTSGLSPLGAVLVGVCIFLTLTLAFLGYLWVRIRGLRLDPTAYSALRAGPDMAGEGVQ
jgi:hypothetical protein